MGHSLFTKPRHGDCRSHKILAAIAAPLLIPSASTGQEDEAQKAVSRADELAGSFVEIIDGEPRRGRALPDHDGTGDLQVLFCLEEESEEVRSTSLKRSTVDCQGEPAGTWATMKAALIDPDRLHGAQVVSYYDTTIGEIQSVVEAEDGSTITATFFSDWHEESGADPLVTIMYEGGDVTISTLPSGEEQLVLTGPEWSKFLSTIQE